MSTELQRQIESVKKQQIKTATLSHGRASIFLSAKEAAAVDTQVVFEAALKAVETLAQYDNRFEGFMDDLLHPSSVNIQRELKTADVRYSRLYNHNKNNFWKIVNRKIKFWIRK